jgi:rRNA biogenesis protein RRP5
MTKLKMKKKRARLVWRRWLEFEESVGNEKGVERVKAIEKEWWAEREGGDEED